MDETLYYVESPDGQVLGPMSMMHILEGVAAGAVLEDARICEVGQSEWIELADVAYSREVEPTAGLEAPRLDDAVVRGSGQSVPFEIGEVHDPSVRDLVVDDSGSEGDPVWAAEIEGALAALESEALGQGGAARAAETSEPIDRTDFPAPDVSELPDTWSTPAPRMPESDLRPHSFAAPPEPARPQAMFLEPDVPIGARAAEAFEASEETVVVHEAPQEHASAAPSEPPSEFAFRMEHADAEPAGVEEDRSPRRMPIPVPALVAIGLAVLGGAYVIGSGMFRKDTASTSPSPAPAQPADVAANADDPAKAGWAELGAGRAAKALPLFQAAVEAQPDDARAHHGLGVAALETRKLDLAAVHLEKAAEMTPQDARVHVDLGRVRLAQGRPELAVEEATRAQSLDAAEAGALLLLGRAHAAAKRPDDAVKALAAFVEASPKNVEARKDLAQALADAGRVAPAVDEIGTYLQAHPGDRDMQLARLDWMLAIGQGVPAAKLYPDDAKDDAFAQYLAGTARTGTEEGVTCLRRATELDPKHRDAWVRLANAQAAIGRTKDAASSLQRAFALAPASAVEKRLLAKWTAGPEREPAVAIAKPEPAKPAPAKPTQAAVTPAPALPDPAPAPKAASVVTLADRVDDIRRSLARADFSGARRTSEAGRAELTGAEAVRNLNLWNAIIDFEEGRFAEAQVGLESLDADASYLGFGKGAVNNWLGRVLLARGQARAAIGAFDQVPAEDPNEYAAAQLWQGVAMSALGMQDLASRTWARIREDVGGRVGTSGKASLRSADFLTGAIAEKDYRTALSSSSEFENDMHFFLGWATRTDTETARAHFRDAVQSSRGREFPYHLAEAEFSGGGLAK